MPSVELSPALVADLAATGAAAGVLALLLAALALLRVSRLSRRHGSNRREGTGPSFAAAPVDLRAEPTDASSGQGRGGAIRNVAVVRYNAFHDIGGQLSFSAALLDDDGDGLVLTVINGRSETRTYAKDIRDGTSVHRLSDDEVEAIDQALGRTRQP